MSPEDPRGGERGGSELLQGRTTSAPRGRETVPSLTTELLSLETTTLQRCDFIALHKGIRVSIT